MSRTFALFCFLFALSAGSFPESDPSVDYAGESYRRDRIDFGEQLTAFSHSLKNEIREEAEWRSSLRSLRNSYKKFEHFVCFFEGEYIRFYINGAPLPRTQFQQDSLSIYEPEGLQLLDELLAEEALDQSEIQEVVHRLQKNWKQLDEFEDRRRFNKRKILLAMRAQILRIATMGVTGFDTPGSLNGLEESQFSLASLQKQLETFQTNSESAESIQSQLVEHFKSAHQYLGENSDFDSFDRAHFLRDLIAPIYSSLLDFHQSLEVKTFTARSAEEEALNYQARNIFGNDFLNPYYFTVLRKKQDNEEMQELGALLFYDPALSKSNKMSCSSCHHPDKAFAEHLKSSISNEGKALLRNAPALLNSVYSSKHFWDLRADKLEAQTNNVVDNPEEFHTDFPSIATKLSKSEEYQQRFNRAFEYAIWSETKIDQYTISTALTSYVMSLRDWNSPFDQYMRGERKEIEQEVKDGFNLFMGKAACATCHFPPTFAGLVPPDFHENETEVLGVPVDKTVTELDQDIGRFGSGRPMDKAEHYQHSFKTVTVRNAEKSAPYMHNGVFDTLEEVVDFYDHGGGAGAGLEVPYQTLGADSLNLTEQEKKNLLAFMRSLNSENYRANIPKELPAFPSESELGKLERVLPY